MQRLPRAIFIPWVWGGPLRQILFATQAHEADLDIEFAFDVSRSASWRPYLEAEIGQQSGSCMAETGSADSNGWGGNLPKGHVGPYRYWA